MNIYILLVIFIFLLDFIRKQGNISKLTYCIIIGSMFALVTGLRSQNVGSDTVLYYMSYERLRYVRFLAKLLIQHDVEQGFYIYTWCLHKLNLPFWSLTLSIATFFYYVVSLLIYKHSDKPAMSYLILMAFNFFQFSMTGMRQTAALGFILLALSQILKENGKIWKIVVLIFVASLFHKSALVCLLYIPIKLWGEKFSLSLQWLSPIAILVGFSQRHKILSFMQYLSDDSKYKVYSQMTQEGGGFTTYIVFLAIFIIALIYFKPYIKAHIKGSLIYWLMFFAIIFQATVLLQSIMFRIAWYFSISLVILLPNLLNVLPKDSRPVANTVTLICLLYMYFFITIGSGYVLPYQFFWEA